MSTPTVWDDELYKYLHRSDIKQAIEDENLDYVYEKLTPGIRWALTKFLYEHDIDPLDYVEVVYEMMFCYHDQSKLVLPENICHIEDNAFHGSKIMDLVIANSICSIDVRAFNGLNPLCKILYSGYKYGPDGKGID